MTKWSVRRVIVGKILPMWQVFRIVDGVEEIEGPHYSFHDEAVKVMHRLNARLEEEEEK